MSDRFDPRLALKYAVSIARPRRVGSGADEEVAAKIVERLRGWGYKVEQQPFTFYTTSEVFLKSLILVSLFLVVALLISHDGHLAVICGPTLPVGDRAGSDFSPVDRLSGAQRTQPHA